MDANTHSFRWLCPECGREFPYRSYAVRHVERTHPQATEILARLKGEPYSRAKLFTEPDPGKPDVTLDILLAEQSPQVLLQAFGFANTRLGLGCFSREALTMILKHLVAAQKRFAEVRSEIETKLGLPEGDPNGDNLISSVKNNAAWRKKLRVFQAYGSKCSCCGEERPELLLLSSASGKPLGKDIYTWVTVNGFPAGYQVLCFNCNMSRGLYGLCPHELERSAKPEVEIAGTA